MKLVTLCIAAFASFAACKPPAKVTDDISTKVTLASFTCSEDYRLIDTLDAAELPACLSDERTLSADSVTQLQNLLAGIQKNGTDDVAKCFIPRHSINFYKGEQLEKFVLVCFECEGIRFSEKSGLTPVKNAEKRIGQMNQLKKYFALK
jgi:hypothetical protein